MNLNTDVEKAIINAKPFAQFQIVNGSARAKLATWTLTDTIAGTNTLVNPSAKTLCVLGHANLI